MDSSYMRYDGIGSTPPNKPLQDFSFWFRKEVTWWRTLASLGWAVILSLPVTIIITVIAQFSLLHPLKWISECIYGSFNIQNMFAINSIVFVVMLVAAFSAKHYSVHASWPRTRLGFLWSLVCPSKVLHCAMLTVCGGIVGWVYTSIVGPPFANLIKPCTEKPSSRCVNEPHLFVVLHAAFVAVVYSVLFFVHGSNILQFPVIQQAKFFRVKGSLLRLCVHSSICVLKRVVYFYLLYYILLGQFARNVVLTALDMTESKDEPSMNTLWGLLDVNLLWNTWLCGTLVHILLSLPCLVYRIYNTQPYEFPLETAVEEYRDKCLHNALAARKYPLLQYLGYQDLYLISCQSPQRRSQLFSLTQLGGHALNWQRVSDLCLADLQAFTEAVTIFNNRTLAAGHMRQISGEKTPLSTRHRSVNSNSGSVTEISPLDSSDPNRLKDPINDPLQTSLAIKPGFLAKMRKLKAVSFLLDELPELASKALFADAQRHIWAVQAMSHLVTASFSEDKYGVVQKSLGEILSTLISLQEALEKHLKLGLPAANTGIRKGTGQQSTQQASSLGLEQCGSQSNTSTAALRSELKAALYRIVATFGNHLNSMQLTTEQKRKLNLFMEYKE